jgi:hypothetical protein
LRVMEPESLGLRKQLTSVSSATSRTRCFGLQPKESRLALREYAP